MPTNFSLQGHGIRFLINCFMTQVVTVIITYTFCNSGQLLIDEVKYYIVENLTISSLKVNSESSIEPLLRDLQKAMLMEEEQKNLNAQIKKRFSIRNWSLKISRSLLGRSTGRDVKLGIHSVLRTVECSICSMLESKRLTATNRNLVIQLEQFPKPTLQCATSASNSGTNYEWIQTCILTSFEPKFPDYCI